MPTESLLLAVTRVSTMQGEQILTNATGFFFERDERLFLVTNRHVVCDEPSNHRPDALAIEFHVDPENVAAIQTITVPLYDEKQHSLWRQGSDTAGMVDVAVLELDRAKLPNPVDYRAFTPAHLVTQLERIEVGTSLIVVGFPLGFHDTLHHLPVARQAVVASAFGIRFQGCGYFLTDARTHRGISGAPVVSRTTLRKSDRDNLAWMLLGVHASRIDVTDRDVEQDARLSLNCAWYADILLTLTEDAVEGGRGKAEGGSPK